jgi:protein-L-isoaspartate(D-aspartate) O-methyltransferase
MGASRLASAGGKLAETLLRIGVLTLLALVSSPPSKAAREPDYATEREEMVSVIEAHAREASPALGRDHIDPDVLRVMGSVPRHEFVPESQRDESYADTPLPIGHGQTISQPFIVALMTDILEVGANGVVLEVGTGSGYQAAVLAHVVRQVYTIEIIPALAQEATDRLARLGFSNVSVREGDGYYGWKEAAPFDGIIVTAAASHIPPPLLAQLKPGGRMVIPVGPPFGLQQLVVVEHDSVGRFRTRRLIPVQFVPFAGPHD